MSDKKRDNFADIGLDVGMHTDFDPVKAYFKCSPWFGKRMPTQNWGNLLSELHVPHEQCLTGISGVFSAFFNQCLSIFIRGS